MNASTAIRRSLRVVLPVALVVLILGALLLSGAFAAPLVITDKVEYGPNEVVTVDGTGFIGSTDYAVPVIWPDGIVRVWNGSSFVTGYDTVTTDASGAFTYLYQLEDMYGMYEVRVYPSPWSGDLSEPAITTTTFLDAIGKSLNQCRNGPFATPIDPCAWHNSNLNVNNSHYSEGQVVPFRGTLTQVPEGATHFLRITYDFTAGGIPAYDFLARFDLIDSPDPCPDLPSGVEASWNSTACPPTGRSTDTGNIPADTFSAYIPGRSEDGFGPGTCDDGIDNQGVDDPTPPLGDGADAADPDCSLEVPDTDLAQSDRQIEIRGGTILDIGTVQDCTVGTTVGVTLDTVEVSAPEHDGPTNANSTACVDVEFKADTSGCTLGLCTVLILWGGHLAAEADWGDGNGASNISGAPFHMSYMLDGADGKPDRSIKPGAIMEQGTINVVKQTDPDGAADTFSFTTTGGLDPSIFDLTDNGTQTYTVAPGSYSVTETVPTGWDLTGITCVDPTTNSSGDTGTGTATIVLDDGETVTCTFTNTKRGTVIIEKTAVGGDDTFSYTGTGAGIPANFNITTTGGTGSQPFSNIDPGAKTVTESGPPSGWSFTSLVCNDPDNGSSVVGQTANIDLDPGETVTCTVTNTFVPPVITVTKVVDNTGGGSAVASDFNLHVQGQDFSDDGSGTLLTLTPGAYDVTEDDAGPAYTTAFSAGCSGTAAAGDTLTCTVTNTFTPPPGTVIIEKTCVAGNDTFGYTGTGSGIPANFNITCVSGSGSQTFADIDAGAKSVTEAAPPTGWVFTSLTCTDPDNGTTVAGQTATIDLDPGETVTCTFTNTPTPTTLTVDKVCIPSSDPGLFNLLIDGNIEAPDTPCGGSTGPVVVSVGPHTVSETAGAGTDLADYNTVIGDDCADDGSVDLALGENKTCTITNTIPVVCCGPPAVGGVLGLLDPAEAIDHEGGPASASPAAGSAVNAGLTAAAVLMAFVLAAGAWRLSRRWLR